MSIDYNLPEGFDINDTFGSGQGEDPFNLSAIAIEFEWTDWTDIIAANGTFDPDDVRPGVYAYPEDAIQDAYDRGILDFSTIWWDGEYWHLVVDYVG